MTISLTALQTAAFHPTFIYSLLFRIALSNSSIDMADLFNNIQVPKNV